VAVERHLLEGLIPAVYTNLPRAPGTPAPRLRRPPKPDLARRWLTLLATHLQQHQTSDLAWWQLPRLIPQRTLKRAGWLAGGLTFVLLFVAARMGALVVGPASLLAVALAYGLVLAQWEEAPAQVKFQIQRIGGGLGGLTCGSIGMGLLVAFFTASAVSGSATTRLATGLIVAFLSGFILMLAFGLVFGLQSPVDDALAVTPLSLLRSDRTVALVSGLGLGLAFGLAFGLVSWLTGGLAFGLTFGPVVGLVAGFGSTCWGRFAIARVWLAARGRLPLRLVAFLDDAHRRGVLRQVGAVYQFRHARLQVHLADTSSTSQTYR
jgi:hypothetical protein